MSEVVAFDFSFFFSGTLFFFFFFQHGDFFIIFFFIIFQTDLDLAYQIGNMAH